MQQVRVIDSRELNYQVRGDSPGMAYVARAVDSDISQHMGIGFARWEGALVDWQVMYDEVIFVIEGCFELTVGDDKFDVRPGQLLWIPKGTQLTYGGHALFGYVVYPGNWKQLNGLA